MLPLKKLQACLLQFDEETLRKKKALLLQLSKQRVFSFQTIQSYFHALIFLRVYATDKHNELVIIKELDRLSKLLKKSPKLLIQAADSGLPYGTLTTRYSVELCCYLQDQKEIQITLDSFQEEGTLRELLAITLPASEKEYATAEISSEEFLETLQVKPKDRVSFLLDQVLAIQGNALTKEHYWQHLKLFISFQLKQASVSIPWNCLSFTTPFYSTELLRKFDIPALLHSPIPHSTSLNDGDKQELIKVIRYSMFLTLRETDTSTYMAPESLTYYTLERGYSVAFYGMKSPHQLPMQSYIGYTLFRNGYPMAYGGSWILGNTARFGLNLFEWFRGGESAYVFAQLLRLYKQVYSLKRIEVDAYQFGKDNPDGIQSGAFWFYYRFGFRPMDEPLAKLAEKEMKKIQQDKTYRSSEKTLIQLAESDMVLVFEPSKSMPWDFSLRVTQYVSKKFQGHRGKAIEVCKQNLLQFISMHAENFDAEVLDEWALLASVFQLLKKGNEIHLIALLQNKVINPVRYNQALQHLFQ